MYVVIATKPVLIGNPLNNAQLQGMPYHSLKLHPGVCSSVGKCGEGQTDTQMAVANIHFASAMPHVKCNKLFLNECGKNGLVNRVIKLK